jgi:hypothetical protein
MIATKESLKALCQVKLLRDMHNDNVLALMDFSSRLFIPWIGIFCAHKAAHDSKDLELLLELASRKASFIDTEQENTCWRKVAELATVEIVNNITDVLASPRFVKIDGGILEEVLRRVRSPGPWTEETVTVSTGWKNQGTCEPNAHGYYLRVQQRGKYDDFKDVHVWIHLQEEVTDTSAMRFTIGTVHVSIVDAEITAKACEESDEDMSDDSIKAEDIKGSRYGKVLILGDEKSYVGWWALVDEEQRNQYNGIIITGALLSLIFRREFQGSRNSAW